MRKYIVGNWKANKTEQEVRTWVKEVYSSGTLSQTSDRLEVLLAPSFLYLQLIHELSKDQLALCTQSISPYGSGPYTGAVSAQQAAQYARYALVGHAERRTYFHETDQIVAEQARQALDAGLTPIIAVDDQNWGKRLMLLNADEIKLCIVMYEPPGAISTSSHGQAAALEEVVEPIVKIRESLKPKAVLYGGSVSAANVMEYLGHPDIDGVVPGAASLDYQDFIELVRAAYAAVPSSTP
jgi:triosephosphate isomerase